MTRKFTRSLTSVLCVVAVFATSAVAQDRGSAAKARDSKEIKTAWKPVVSDASKVTVRVKCGGKDAELGTVVGPDGWILTKASELRAPITVRMNDGKEIPAKVVGLQPAYD